MSFYLSSFLTTTNLIAFLCVGTSDIRYLRYTVTLPHHPFSMLSGSVVRIQNHSLFLISVPNYHCCHCYVFSLYSSLVNTTLIRYQNLPAFISCHYFRNNPYHLDSSRLSISLLTINCYRITWWPLRHTHTLYESLHILPHRPSDPNNLISSVSVAKSCRNLDTTGLAAFSPSLQTLLFLLYYESQTD